MRKSWLRLHAGLSKVTQFGNCAAPRPLVSTVSGADVKTKDTLLFPGHTCSWWPVHLCFPRIGLCDVGFRTQRLGHIASFLLGWWGQKTGERQQFQEDVGALTHHVGRTVQMLIQQLHSTSIDWKKWPQMVASYSSQTMQTCFVCLQCISVYVCWFMFLSSSQFFFLLWNILSIQKSWGE